MIRKNDCPILTIGLLLFLLFQTAPAYTESGVGPKEKLSLARVIDGDSIALENGKELRYVGVNAPEWDQSSGKQSSEFNRTLLQKSPGKLFFRRCTEQSTDRYGRILGFVEAKGKDVQAELLKKGLVTPMVIPPCGLIRVTQYERFAAQARRQQLGVWKKIRAEILTPEAASQHIHEYRGVRGKVRNIHRGKKSIHLNFGKDWREDFSVTILERDLAVFQSSRIDPVKKYRDKEVIVYGYIQQYYGPQIKVFSPLQIELQ